jgi:hypothetical protein
MPCIPEQFVRKHVVAHTEPGDIVFDPFSGRGTTVLEALLLGRPAFGTDLNPVAVCLSNAKAAPPAEREVLARISQLEKESRAGPWFSSDDEFFKLCFHAHTLGQLMWLRDALRWRTDTVDCFIAAVALGCLHGESHKTFNCFSNRMPRTISTKKNYSVAWWLAGKHAPPKRDVFDILRDMVSFRLATERPKLRGRVEQIDARIAASAYTKLRNRVSLVVTSPPYLDVTNYAEDQWLRLWFLGGKPYPTRSSRGDDRHTSTSFYWKFLEQAWVGVAPLLKASAVVVVRIGGMRLGFEEARDQLKNSLTAAFDKVRLMDAGYVSELRHRQTDSFRPGTTGRRVEFDFRFRVA